MDLTLQLNQMRFIKGTDFRKSLIDNGHLGQGNNRVYNVIVGGKQYALKQLVNQGSIENEIKIMQSLSNTQYVINLIDYMILETISADKYTLTQQFAYLLMEKAEKNLDSYIRERKQYMSNDDLYSHLEQLINIFEYLQQQNIAHRDIKLENILVMQNATLKACDVGCSSHIDTQQTITVVGTKSYLAPELLNAESTRLKHNPFKSDVYSLGLCCLYLVTLQHWQDRMKVSAIIEEEIVKDYLKHVKRITADDTLIVNLLKQMLTINPENRPDFIELKIKFKGLRDEQTKSLSKGLTLDSFESPKKSISQYDYLSPDLSVSSRGRNTGPNFYHQERQKSAKNLSNSKKQQSSTNLFSESFNSKKRIPSKSPKQASSPSQLVTKPPSAHPKLAQTTKANSYKVPQTPLQQPQQQRVMSKFHQSVNDNSRKMQTEFSQTMPAIQTFAPLEVKQSDNMLECDFDEICRHYQHEQYVCLYQGKQVKKCILPSQCRYLFLKLNNQSPEFYVDPMNVIQILVLEIIDDNPKDANTQRWCESIANLQFQALTQVEIIVSTKQSQANNIITFLNKVESIKKVTITIQSDLAEQDHRTIVWRLSKYNCSSLALRIPRVKLLYTQISQLWHFNKSLEDLYLDYEDCDLAPAFSLLTAALRTVELKKFHFNFSKSQSKNSEISLFLEYLGAKNLLKELTLIMDSLIHYDKMVQEKLKNNIAKLKNLDRIYLSLIGNPINLECFERLFNIFCSMEHLKLIILRIDRLFDKESIKQIKKIFNGLDAFKLQFYGTTKTLTIIMHNNGLNKKKDYGVTKCNQGKQIHSSHMYICIKCSKLHSFFLKEPFQICSTCVTTCHSKCEPTADTPTSDSLAQSQIMQRVIRKNHTFIESFNTQDHRCYCHLLGTCSQMTQTRDRQKHQLQWRCTLCNKNLCGQCYNDCLHSGHPIKEMYICKFNCECECDKHV